MVSKFLNRYTAFLLGLSALSGYVLFKAALKESFKQSVQTPETTVFTALSFQLKDRLTAVEPVLPCAQMTHPLF